MSGPRRVVITGTGAVTPLGLDSTSTWNGMVQGRSGVRKIDLFPADTYPVTIAGQVPPFDPRDLVADQDGLDILSRAGLFGLSAAEQALAEAGGVDIGIAPERRSVSVGATAGRPDLQEMAEFFHRIREELPLFRPDVDEVLRRREHVPTAMIARSGRCEGAAQVFSTACTASGHAIGEAFRQIQDGDADFVLAGGYDSLITWLDVLGFSLLGALTSQYADEPERASRPFSEDRSGFVLGEGGVVFALEERGHALARGATIQGEIVGYAATMNAYRMTDPPPHGGAIITCMDRALAEAGVSPSDVGYIAAHGTSTPGNDLTETEAIRTVFSSAATDVAISSVKSMVGHLTAAAAGLGTLGALGALREGMAPPTINLDRPDPKLDLNYVANTAQPLSTDFAMVNAFAFGGTNTCIILKRGD